MLVGVETLLWALSGALGTRGKEAPFSTPLKALPYLSPVLTIPSPPLPQLSEWKVALVCAKLVTSLSPLKPLSDLPHAGKAARAEDGPRLLPRSIMLVGPLNRRQPVAPTKELS